MRSAGRHAVFAQIFGFLGLLVNNLVIPSFVGVESFGRLSLLLGMPYFLQGLVESSCLGFMTRLAVMPRVRSRYGGMVVRILSVYMLVGVLLALVAARAVGGSPVEVSLAVLVLVASCSYTLFQGHLLSVADTEGIMRSSLALAVGLAVLPPLACVPLGGGVAGLMAGVVLAYVLAAMLASWHKGIAAPGSARDLWVRARVEQGRTLQLVRVLAFRTGPRLLFVTVNTAVLLLVGYLHGPSVAAVYKLAISAVIAVLYSVPLHPGIWCVAFHGWSESQRIRSVLLAAAWILLGSAAYYLLIPQVFAYFGPGYAQFALEVRRFAVLVPLLYVVWIVPFGLDRRVRLVRLLQVSLGASVWILVALWLLGERLESLEGTRIAVASGLAMFVVWFVHAARGQALREAVSGLRRGLA